MMMKGFEEELVEKALNMHELQSANLDTIIKILAVVFIRRLLYQYKYMLAQIIWTCRLINIMLYL